MNRCELLLLLGCAVAAPHAPSAQQKAMPVIGVLNITSAQRNPNSPFWAAFRQGLGETGYVEGQNVAFEFRSAEWHYDRLALLAADLVGRKADVIVALNVSALAAKNATSTIPIVFAVGSDPVVDGLVASLARPGGNLTGFTSFNLELMPRHRQLVGSGQPDLGGWKMSQGLTLPNAADFRPEVEALAPGSSVLGGSDMAAADIKQVIDLIVG